MKKLFFTAAFAVILLICSIGLQAQTTQTKLDQLELMKQFVGTWRAYAGKDTVQIWTCRPYGKTFIIEVIDVINGKGIPLYFNNVGYDTRDDKIKGYILWPNGHYETYIAAFSSEKSSQETWLIVLILV